MFFEVVPTKITNINSTRINANPPVWLTPPPLFPWQQVFDKISPRYILCNIILFVIYFAKVITSIKSSNSFV